MRWFVLVVVSGCAAPQFVPRPGQERAIRIVWTETYGETGHPPQVDWVRPPDLDCADGLGFWHGTFYGDTENKIRCVGGLYWGSPDVAQVALPVEHGKFSGTAFSHELLHAHFLSAGIELGDADHSRPEWKSSGLLWVAEEALETEGL